MVSHRVLFVFATVAVCFLQFVFAAPKPNPTALRDREALVQKFAEFLHEDHEFSAALENINADEDHFVRNKRQATSRSPSLDDEDFETPQQEKPGFFDRAAKFVTELLQRFLKWINSNEN